MSISGYLSPGNDVQFQLNIDGERFTYAGTVYDMNDRTLSIEIDDEGLKQKQICKGMKALLLGQCQNEKISLPVRIENSDTLPMLHLREHNSTGHFRVNGFIRLKYRTILGKEYLRIRDQYRNKIDPENDMELTDSGSNERLESDLNTNAIPAKIVDTINLLKEKLNYLQEVTINSQDADLFEHEPVKVNISGSGLRFNSRNTFQVGDLLDLKMVLPSSPFSVIKTVALVVRMDDLSKEEASLEEGSHLVAAKFIVVNEDDRNSIIKYTLACQRKMLRQKQVFVEDVRYSTFLLSKDLMG